MLAAPLMAGNDLHTMSAATKSILTNRDVIAIDQDTLGKQCRVAYYRNNLEVFVKPLQNGDTAVCFFNRSDEPKKIDLPWADLHLGSDMMIRDVWKNQAQGTTATPFRSEIAKHAVILLRLSQR